MQRASPKIIIITETIFHLNAKDYKHQNQTAQYAKNSLLSIRKSTYRAFGIQYPFLICLFPLHGLRSLITRVPFGFKLTAQISQSIC